MSPLHPFLPGLAEKVAVSAVMNLLKASALGIQRRLGRGEAETALQAAVGCGECGPARTPAFPGGRCSALVPKMGLPGAGCPVFSLSH
jgi:hypothetical protein